MRRERRWIIVDFDAPVTCVNAVADLDLDGSEFHTYAAGVKPNDYDCQEIRRLFTVNGLTNIAVTTANTLNREVAGKGTRDFTVFLAAGRKLVAQAL